MTDLSSSTLVQRVDWDLIFYNRLTISGGMNALFEMEKFAIVIPTLNAAPYWDEFERKILACAAPEQVLIIDSSSSDNTRDLASRAGFRLHIIRRSEFGHGRTRQLAAEMLQNAEVIVFLTQDTVLADSDAVPKLLRAFQDPTVGAAFGRQLPRVGATPIEAHARIFNYPPQSSVRSLANRADFGFKAIFISNSFAAYRRAALMAAGGFPEDVIFGEDTIAAAGLLLSKWKIAYVSEAMVYHSHAYTWTQEFKRYFDIGVLHSRERKILNQFGGTSEEGGRFVSSELAYLWPRYCWLIPSALIRTACKLAGYRLGRVECKLSARLKKRLSMHPEFWG